MNIHCTSIASAMALAVFLATAPATVTAASHECVRVVTSSSSGEKQTMDPAHAWSADDAAHLAAIYETLIDLDNGFQPVPRLAESWESNADGTQWTFHLREDVKFHDGSDFDAGDVVHTYRRLLDPEIGSAGLSLLAAFLEPDGIQAIDKHTVRFTATQPTAELPILIWTKFSGIVSEGAKSEDLKVHGNGTGPFVEDKFTIGAPVRVLKRNANYWAPGVPKAECLRISTLPEQVTRLAAVLGNEVDVILEPDLRTVAALKEDARVSIVGTPGARVMSISLWVDTPPFDDVRVRQALKFVVDRQAIVDTVMLGYGEPGNDNPVSPSSSWAYTHDIRTRDVAKAKQLLAEAGHSDGLKIDFYTGDAAPGMVDIAQAYAQMAADAGIEVNLINTPADSFWDDVWMKRPMHSGTWIARPPQAALSIAYRKEADWNETHWRRDDYDALLDEAGQTVDTQKRKQLLQDAQRLLADEGGVIIPAFRMALSVLRKDCSGYEPHIATGAVYDLRTIECSRSE